MVRAAYYRRVVAVSFASVRLGVGSCIILNAKCEILMSLFLLVTFSMVKKQGEQ